MSHFYGRLLVDQAIEGDLEQLLGCSPALFGNTRPDLSWSEGKLIARQADIVGRERWVSLAGPTSVDLAGDIIGAEYLDFPWPEVELGLQYELAASTELAYFVAAAWVLSAPGPRERVFVHDNPGHMMFGIGIGWRQ